MISGDFNQWKVNEALQDFQDLREAPVGPARGSRQIDRKFTNFGSLQKSAWTIPPLAADDPSQRQPNDHRVSAISIHIPRVEAYCWLKYQYRYYNKDSVQKFQDWIVAQTWEEVASASGSNSKTEI